MAIGGHQSARSKTDDWITPRYILKDLGPFDLDPCASQTQPWATATCQWTVRDDGLLRKWGGLVWMNPPYGSQIALWLRRLAEHGQGIALVFARTETRAFAQWVWPEASAVKFLLGRLHFATPEGIRMPTNSGGPSILIAYGDTAKERLRRSRLPGPVMTDWR